MTRITGPGLSLLGKKQISKFDASVALENDLRDKAKHLLTFVYEKGDGTFNDKLHDLLVSAADFLRDHRQIFSK